MYNQPNTSQTRHSLLIFITLLTLLAACTPTGTTTLEPAVVDPETGVVTEAGHDLEGQSIAGKFLIFPTGKGSTVGSYVLYRLKKNGHAPLAIINAECETITTVGCIISEIPCIDQINLSRMETGMQITLDAETGSVTIS